MGDETNAKASPGVSFTEQTLLSPGSPESQQHGSKSRISIEGSPSLSPKEPPPRKSAVSLSPLPDPQLPPAVTLTDVEIQHHARDDAIPAHGIYWKSPFIMTACLLIGVLACVGHGVYYAHLQGAVVGVVDFQEKNIRVGSFFAFLAQCMMSSSCWFSYYQWLWRAMKDNEISLRGLDAAFNAETSLLALLNPEVMKNVKVGYILAVIAWLLQLPSLITPATLFVIPGAQTIIADGMVPVLAINDPTRAYRFAYSTAINHNATKDDTHQFPEYVAFSGPRSIVTTISDATASSGTILALPPPSNRSSYSVVFNSPYALCSPANSTAQEAIQQMVNQQMARPQDGYKETVNAYYAFVPSFDASSDPSNTVMVNATTLTGIAKPRAQQPGNATNQLWMTFWRYKTDQYGKPLRNSDNTKIPERHYSVCKLYNATYDVRFSFDGATQTVSKNKIDIHEPVGFPRDNADKPSNIPQHAFSSVFWALADQAVGSMGFYNSTAANASTPAFSSLDTQIQHNSLLGSNDLDYFFDMNKLLYWNNTDEILSDQRLRDKALAKNQTLDYLIEDLAFNITISLMSDPLLAPNLTTQIEQISPVNRYAFSYQNLLLAYGLAILATAVANVLGLIAYKRNGASHDRALSTTLSVASNGAMPTLFPQCSQGRLPVPRQTMDMPLRLNESPNGALSLEPTGEHRVSVCDACVRASHGGDGGRRLSLINLRRLSTTMVANEKGSDSVRQRPWWVFWWKNPGVAVQPMPTRGAT